MAYSFGTSGSTPALPTNVGGGNSFLSGYNSNPVSKALGAASGGMNPVPANPAPPFHATPTTAVKSQTDAAGNTTTYHAPTPVDTSSFTPAQLTAFNNANALGSGVGTTSGLLSNPSTQSNASTNTNSQPLQQYASGSATYAPGSIGNNGGPGQVNAPGTAPTQYTTPSGATVDSSGNLISNSPSTTNASNQSSASSASSNQNITNPGLLSTLSSVSAGNLPIGQNAANIASDYGQQIADTSALRSQLEGSTGGTEPVVTGLSGLAENMISQKQNALATGEEAALQGTSQQLTAQNQAQQGTEAGVTATLPANQNVTPPAGAVTTNALTGQQYSNPIYEPSTGAYTPLSPQPNGTPGQPSTVGQATSYTVQSGDTFDSLAQKYGTTAQALEAANPGVNPNDMQIGSSLTIPSQTGGNSYGTGVVGGANAQSVSQLTQQNNNYVNALNQINTQAPTLANLITTNQINPSFLNFENGIVQAVGSQTSNAAYQDFAANLNDFASRFATILTPAGQSPTNLQTQIGQQLFNASSQGSSLLSTLNYLTGMANNVIAGNNTTIKNLGGTPTTGNSATQSSNTALSEGGTYTTNLGTYKFNNGKLTFF